MTAANNMKALIWYFQWKGTLWWTAFCMLHESEQPGKREINKIKSLMFFSLSPSHTHVILSQNKNQESGRYLVKTVNLTK